MECRLTPYILPLLLALSPLACTKATGETPNDDSQMDDSPTAEDSGEEEDTEVNEHPRVFLNFYTGYNLAGYGFYSEEGDGFGLLREVRADGVVGQNGKPGHWWALVISEDLTACDQGETTLVNDGESHQWEFIDYPFPGEFLLEEFTCLMPR